MSDKKSESREVETGPFRGLGLLDPSFDDESYWARFRVRVMTRAADELFRRRIAADVSVVGVVEGWAKTLVPVAALAAVLAGFLLLSDYRASVGHADVEEILLAELDNPVLPSVDDAGTSAIRFASEGF
jgi:hypothetical protein